MIHDRSQSWINRAATIACAVCFGMLAVGLIIEIVTDDMLFESYISTFSGYGLIFALVASLSRRPASGL